MNIRHNSKRSKVSSYHIFCFDARVVVLALFESWFVTKFHRLMRTEMYACQAELTTVAVDGTLIHHLDVRHRTHLRADTATDTFVGIGFRTQGFENHTRE